MVAWGWEEVDFYAKWMRFATPEDAIEMKGPVLNLGSPQTQLSEGILELAREVLLKDPEYVERIKRHYKMVRFKVESQPGKKRRKAGP